MMKEWVSEKQNPIVIVGAGMAGISAAFQLKILGITNVLLFDENEQGHEGPWTTYARMRHLRSTKELEGPAHFTPELNFKTYYTSKFGEKKWDQIYKISNQDWNDYLLWLRKTLDLHVENETRLLSLDEKDETFYLHTSKGTYETRRVILATGRMGLGGLRLPYWIDKIPKNKWAHTSEAIDFKLLKGKRVGVVGVGASAFDAAALALEEGALQVDMLSRRDKINNVNKASDTVYAGFELGYYYLSDSDKLSFFHLLRESGAVPPFESVLRVEGHPNFTIHYNYNFDEKIPEYDFLILGTGFLIDASKAPFLKNLSSKFDLWGNHLSEEEKKKYPFAPLLPYLGPHFEMLPYKRLYCFNQAASLSHGLIAGDIPGIGIGAERLAQGIAIELFLEDKSIYYQKLKDFNRAEFDPNLVKRKN